MDFYNRYPTDGIKFCASTGSSEYLDSWIPLTPLEQMESTDYDVIIVGSGAGGGAALWRLCDRWRESGQRIAMLERGELILPSHAMNLPTFNQQRLNQFIENPRFKTKIPSTDTDNPTDFSQFFGLGGRTIHWSVGSPRLHRTDFETWPITYRDLRPYYKAAEQIMGVGYDFTKNSPLQHDLLQRLWANGYTDAKNFPLAINFQLRKNGLPITSVFSSIDLLGYSLNVKNFDLAVNARVVQVLTEKGVASGVKVLASDGKFHIIKGRHIVLAASTLGNPHILLYSGIGSEALGRYLINHTSVTVQTKYAKSYGNEPSGSVAILLPRTNHRLYQIEVHRNQPFVYGADADTKDKMRRAQIVFQGFGVVEPRAENCVALDAGRLDEFGIPRLKVHFAYSQEDLDITQQLASFIRHLAKDIGLSPEKMPCLGMPGAEYHESGTCRMGTTPDDSVTNQFGELHDVSNVYIADSSVLPFIGAANPTLTIIALAIRTADYIHFKVSNQSR